MACSHDTLVRDTSADDVICRTCGLVLTEDQLPPEWDVPSGPCMTRHGLEDLLPGGVVRGIAEICSTMHLCDTVTVEALRLAHVSGLQRGLQPSVAACVYLACKNVRLYRTQHEFEVETKVSGKALGRAISRLLRTLKQSPEGGECVNEMLPRIVSRFASRDRGKISTAKIEQCMREIYRNRWQNVHSGRSVSINTVLAKCLLEALHRVSENTVTRETKGVIKTVCGVKTL